jgi:hypothetical protein
MPNSVEYMGAGRGKNIGREYASAADDDIAVNTATVLDGRSVADCLLLTGPKRKMYAAADSDAVTYDEAAAGSKVDARPFADPNPLPIDYFPRS